MQKKLLSSLLLSTLLAACGGGGGGVSYAIKLGGDIVDGYIYGAKVCLDLNGNLACDDLEPSDISKPGGSYSIAYDGSRGPASQFVVIAEVGANAYDEDDKQNGQWVSLSQAGKNPFNLAAPAVSTDVLVTPLTTLVTHELLSDKTAKVSTESVKAAQEAVKTKLGLTTDVMTLNYVKDNDSEMLKLAQVTATALGEAAKQVNAGLSSQSDTSLTTVAAQRAVQTAIAKTVLDSVMPGVINKSTGTLATASVDEAKRSAAASVTTVVSGVVNNIVASTKAGDATVTDIKAAMKTGFVIAEIKNGFFLRDESKAYGLGQYVNEKRLAGKYSQVDLDAKTRKGVERVYYQGNWVATARWGKDHSLTKDGTWVEDDFLGTSGSMTTDQNCLVINRTNGVEATTRICLVERNLENKLIKSINPDYCNSFPGYTAPASCSAATYKYGSKGYDLTASVSTDRYSIDVPVDPATTWHYGQSMGGNATTVASFLIMLNANIGKSAKVSIWDNYAVQMKSFDGNEGVLNWYYTDPQTNITSDAGTGKIKFVTINKVQMLVFSPSPDYHQRNPGDMVGSDFLFAAKDGKIRMGTVDYAGVKQHMNFGSAGWVGNTKAFDSVLDGLGLKDFPYASASDASSGGGIALPVPSPAEGLWAGTLLNGNTAGVAVLENGESWMFEKNSSDDVLVAYYGQINSASPSDVSGTITAFDLRDPNASLKVKTGIAITGSVVPKSTLTVRPVDPSAGDGGVVMYNNSYDTAASLANVAGTYTVSGKTLDGAINPSILTVGANGLFTKTDGPCQINGAVTPRAGGKGVFDFDMTGSSGCGSTVGQSLSGISILDTRTTPFSFTTIASNANKSTILLLRGVKNELAGRAID